MNRSLASIYHRVHTGLLLGVLAALVSDLTPHASAQGRVDPPERPPVETEIEIVASIRQAAALGDDAAADRQLLVPSPVAGPLAQSAVLARRVAFACGWLKNDNEHGRAQQLAQRAIRQLERMSESDEAARAERLYWEAWLEAEILGNRKRAIELVLEAEKLAPDDPRILDDSVRWAQALAEFGS